MGLHPISIAEALENPILISIDNASSEKLPRVQAALKLVSFDHQKTEKMLSIHLLCFLCFLGGALSTLSRVLAFFYHPVEETDNSSLQRHSD